MKKTDPATAAAWWRALQPNWPDGTRNPTGDRAALAMLRRGDLPAAMSQPITFALFRALGASHANDLPKVALCAAVMAGVREDRPEHPARTLGEPADRPPLKPLRFRRLIEADMPDEVLTALRRAAQLADRRLNLRELAAACLDWSDARRRHWIFEYYGAGRAAPEADTEIAEETVP